MKFLYIAKKFKEQTVSYFVENVKSGDFAVDMKIIN